MNIFKIWKLTKIISLHNEPYLEKWARLFRYNQSLVVIKNQLKCRRTIKILDVGCGQDTLYYKYLVHCFPKHIHKIQYFGIDPLISNKVLRTSQHTLIKQQYEDYFKKTKDTFDLITIFAVLEHVDDPYDLINVLTKLLTRGGFLVGTTPAKPAKPVLEFLSYSLGIISRREIDEHKNYFDRTFMDKIFSSVASKNKMLNFYHKYFELGLNNLFVIKHC